MSYANTNELKNALTSILQPYNFSQTLINQLLSDDFINGAFGLIQNEPENDEFMNFVRNFSEEQNLKSLMDAQDRISKELITEGYFTSILQYVIDSWRDVDFSASQIMQTLSNNDTDDSLKPKAILDAVLEIAEHVPPLRAYAKELRIYENIAIVTYNQDKKFYDIAETFDRQMRELASNLRPLFSTAETTRSPLIVDLDGDGVETTSVSGGVYFDHDGNGFAENSSWVGKDDDILVYFVNDRNLSLTKYTQES